HAVLLLHDVDAVLVAELKKHSAAPAAPPAHRKARADAAEPAVAGLLGDGAVVEGAVERHDVAALEVEVVEEAVLDLGAVADVRFVGALQVELREHAQAERAEAVDQVELREHGRALGPLAA